MIVINIDNNKKQNKKKIDENTLDFGDAEQVQGRCSKSFCHNSTSNKIIII